MAQRPSPDKELIEKVLMERHIENFINPMSHNEMDLSANSPKVLDQSIGRMNSSFSRTKIAATMPETEKSIMDDAKRKLFDSEAEEEKALTDKQNNLIQQLLAQQHELKRLESKQQELMELKKQAEQRLIAANETASIAIKGGVSSNGDTPKKMKSKYNMNEIPYEIENVQEGTSNLVPYDSSDEIEEDENLTIDSFQFDALQKKLAFLHEKQKHLEQQSKTNQTIANNSFSNKQNLVSDLTTEREIEELDTRDLQESGYDVTGHANTADYNQLCSKVEELRERKKYMDKLLSYYHVLRENNNESKVMIDENKNIMKDSANRFGPPSDRIDQPAVNRTSQVNFQNQGISREQGTSTNKNRGTSTNPNQVTLTSQSTSTNRNQATATNQHQGTSTNQVTFSNQSTSTMGQSPSNMDMELLAQIRNFAPSHPPTGAVQPSQHGPKPILPKMFDMGLEQESALEQSDADKLASIQEMRDQLSRIQQEMTTIEFNDNDTADNVTDKLKELEATGSRVRELRDRLAQFENQDDVALIEDKNEQQKLAALERAKHKLHHLHDLAAKVKQARAHGKGIPDDILNEISMIVPKKQEEEDEEEGEGEEEDQGEDEEEEIFSTDEKLSTLLRRKQELETVQNELQQLRLQQQLLHNMEEKQQKQAAEEAQQTNKSVTIPEDDRELLWESLREKQSAQLERLRRAEQRYEQDSNDGYTTRATWGGSSIRSIDTADMDEDKLNDIEGGTYLDKSVDIQAKEEDEKELTDARVIYELETNYWIEHCKELSKQLAERTHTIHMLLKDKPEKKGTPNLEMFGESFSKTELQSKIEQLAVENDQLHSELNEVYGMDTFQNTDFSKRGAHSPDRRFRPNLDESAGGYTPGSQAEYTGAYSPCSPAYPPRPHMFHKPNTPSAYPPPQFYRGYAPPPFMPYPPHPYYLPPHFRGYTPASFTENESNMSGYPGYYNPYYPEYSVSNVGYDSVLDPNSPYVTRRDSNTDKRQNTENKNPKNVSFSLNQVKTSGDTISTQYPTPRKHEAYQKLADSGNKPRTSPRGSSELEERKPVLEEDTQSVTSTISSLVTEKRNEKGTTFDAIQNTVYSEVASLISANESRPHYLLELVRELAGLDNDYLRQRHLYMLRDLVSSYLTSQPEVSDPVTSAQPPSWLAGKGNNYFMLSASEATPSISIASDVENEYEGGADVHDADFDYLEKVENLSSVSTNNSHPFASDSLGSTAINLSGDLADVRKREEMEKKLENMVQEVISKYGIRRSESSSAADNTSECDVSEIESSFSVLEQEVKRVMMQVIPILRDNLSSNLDSELTNSIISTISRTTVSVFDSDQISENFESNLRDVMKRYDNDTVQDCAHNIIVELSEVLFQDVHSSHIIVDEDEGSEMEQESDTEELVLDNGPTPTPQDLRNRFLVRCEYDESDDPELEYFDNNNREVQCAVTDTMSEEGELRIVGSEEEGTVQARFSETGELFSDGGDMSDIVELPPTTEDEVTSNDEIPVKETSAENVLTVEDLPTKLSLPPQSRDTEPRDTQQQSYRDAVTGGNQVNNPESRAVRETNPVASAADDSTNIVQAVLDVIEDTHVIGDDSIIEPATQ